MHHTISYDLAQARIADLRQQAQRDALARAARGPGRRFRPGLRRRALRRTRAVPGTPRPFSPPWHATYPLAEPARVPGRRHQEQRNGRRAHRDR